MMQDASFFSNRRPADREEFISMMEHAIIRGKASAGDKLPTERQLEVQTGLGKSAIHCAMMELEHRGFIEIVPRKGAYVADFAKNGNAETLNAVLRCNGGRMGFKMCLEVVELRNAIEGGAMIRLAKNHTQSDIARLRQALDRLKADDVKTMEVPQIAEIEGAFHLLICELSGNDMFSLVMRSFVNFSSVLWQYCTLFWGVEGFIEHDEAIINMIERGEGHEAQKFIEDIFAQFLEAFYNNKD